MDEMLNAPKHYAAGGTTETNQYGSWGGANAANAISQSTPGASSYSNYTAPATAGPFSTTPGTSPVGNIASSGSGYTPLPGATIGVPGGFGGNLADYPGSPQGYGASYRPMGSKGGSIPAFDDGGEVSDPGGVDPSQGQEGQTGDLAGALSQVQQAYQYGLQQMSGGQQMADNSNAPRPIPPAPGAPGSVPQGVLQPTPKPFNPRDYLPGQQQSSEDDGSTAQAARGGSIPSFQPGGGVPPQVNTATPPQVSAAGAPAPGPVGGAPPHIMRYLSGADAAPIPQVLQRQKSHDPSLPATARTIHTIAGAGGPQQQYQTLQAFRRLSDNAATHAKVSLTGNGKQPASLPHAVMFANKKFEYQPTPYHVSFALKGKGKPTNKAARGGAIQSFDDGGGVEPDAGTTDQNAQYDPINQMAGAGAPITMNISDLKTGQTQSQDVTPQDLQKLVSGTFDSYVAHPSETLAQAVEQAQATGEAGGVYGPIQQPEGTVGSRLRKLVPSAIMNAGQSNQGNPPGEADISGTTQPNWTQTKQAGLPGGTPGSELSTSPGQPSPNEAAQMGQSTAGISATSPGGQLQLGEHGEIGSTTSPGQPTPGEARQIAANSNWGPIDTTPDTGIQVWNAKTGKWDDSTPEEYDAIRGKNPATPVRIPDPANPDSWKTVTTAYFNQNYRDIVNPGPREKPAVTGGQPDVTYGAGERTTNPVETEGPETNSGINVNRYGVNQGNALQAQRSAEAGQAAIPSRNDGGGEGAAEGAAATRGARQAAPRAQRAAPRARAPRAARSPRRVYGRGHAGLGTYQEMADGTAQYLGPQNLTG
jgi:hypothetical protein